MARPVGTLQRYRVDLDSGRLLAFDGAFEHKGKLGSLQRKGLTALLACAAASDPAGGWVDATDILARAPGWGAQQLSSVGKLIQAFRLEQPIIAQLLESQEKLTVGPWRFRLPPEGCVDALERFLERRPLPAKRRVSIKTPAGRRELKRTRKATQDTDFQTLDQMERWVERGVMQPLTSDSLKRLMTSDDVFVRARAKRVEATRLRRLGKLDAARRAIVRALSLFDTIPETPAWERASAKDEAGAIAYHKAELSEAARLFHEEIALMNDVRGDMALRARGLARGNRWMAFVQLRRGEPELAKLAASEARAHAEQSRNRAECALSKLAELRVRVHTGGAEEACEALVCSVISVPASHPVIQLMARRFYAEGLFVSGDTDRAGRLALAVIDDAKELGLAREADAARNLLKCWNCDVAYRMLSRGDVSVKRDQLDDRGMLVGARRSSLGAPGPTARPR